MRKMTIATTILALGFIAALITVIVIRGWYKDLNNSFDMQGKYIDQLEQDKQLLLSDKLDLCRENEQLSSDNDVLADTVRELREINKELMNTSPADRSLDPEKERLPEGNTNTFRCEDFRKIDMRGSEHLALQQKCKTEYGSGLRYYISGGEKYYCAALGGAYGSTIGDAWQVTLKCGSVFKIIFADYKHPDQITNADPNDFGDSDKNYDELPTTSVIEFVYDYQQAYQGIIDAGTMSWLGFFGYLYGDGGNIVKMKYLGRVWEP